MRRQLTASRSRQRHSACSASRPMPSPSAGAGGGGGPPRPLDQSAVEGATSAVDRSALHSSRRPGAAIGARSPGACGSLLASNRVLLSALKLFHEERHGPSLALGETHQGRRRGPVGVALLRMRLSVVATDHQPVQHLVHLRSLGADSAHFKENLHELSCRDKGGPAPGAFCENGRHLLMEFVDRSSASG